MLFSDSITLDRSLTYEKHIEKLCAKLKSRINLIQRLAGWGSSAQTFKNAVMGIVMSTAEFACPIFINSSHVPKIDVQINNAMRIISGAIKSTPLPWLPVMSNIEPPKFRRQMALNRMFAKCDLYQDSMLFNFRKNLPGIRLKRKPPWLNDQTFNIKIKWKSDWQQKSVINSYLVADPTVKLPGFAEKRRIWTTLNRIRCEQGRCNYLLHKWGKVQSPFYDCSDIPQTIKHMTQECALTFNF